MRPSDLAQMVRAGKVKDMHERGRGGKYIFMTTGFGDITKMQGQQKMLLGGQRILVTETDYLEFMEHLKKRQPQEQQ